MLCLFLTCQRKIIFNKHLNSDIHYTVIKIPTTISAYNSANKAIIMYNCHHCHAGTSDSMSTLCRKVNKIVSKSTTVRK